MKKGMKVFALLSMLFFAGVTAISSSPVFSKEFGDIVMDKSAASMKKGGVKPVKFSHWFHRIRYKCKVCHEDIFVMKAGANGVNMTQIMDGKACGTCHNGKIAWEAMYCDKCHSVDEPIAEKGQESQGNQWVTKP